MMNTNPQENLLIVGPSGAGKHLFATQQLVNSLAEGNSAVVFDCGRSYLGIVKALGGTLVTVTNRGIVAEHFGTLPLTVYELEKVAAPISMDVLPNLPTAGGTTFVLVDEVWPVTKRLPGLWSWLKNALELNFRFCGVLQDLSDVGVYDLPAGIRLQRIDNFSPVDTEHLRPGQLVRHQDGGIYRYHSTARHTDDKAELVVYEHVWPFEAGQLWARPAHEWPSRFTPIMSADLREAQKQDRRAAQSAVTNAKAERRAVEASRKSAEQTAEAARKALIEADYNRSVVVPAGSGMTWNVSTTNNNE
ncbi:DUF1653 domain-containing protein [Burkholderia ubonensis]|uniref:DUF1653 domain-containing protein n=1 Tax=Burkholderia ubonensis TaxID=101571 RepID=UPI0007C66A9F|nr:DUF1653 domain-containing protein [Burkholderia ubonensis]